ncbi:MAG: Fibronectin type domain protein, partial [Labilithrix sp.]|nr:Fibronectin type domain protein [Labilithrix sp.]
MAHSHGRRYPLEVGESAVPTVPTGVYTGNGKDELLLDPETVSGGGGFQVNTTMRSYGVPWHIGRAGDHDALQIGNNNRDAVLTIEAGTKILFEAGAVLQIEAEEDGGASAIRALGTADRPVVFSSAATAPAPGDWRGLYFNGPPSDKNALQHVRIEYTGADCHCSMVTCTEGVGTYEAAIIFSRPPPRMFLESSVLAHGSGHGVVAG